MYCEVRSVKRKARIPGSILKVYAASHGWAFSFTTQSRLSDGKAGRLDLWKGSTDVSGSPGRLTDPPHVAENNTRAAVFCGRKRS